MSAPLRVVKAARAARRRLENVLERRVWLALWRLRDNVPTAEVARLLQGGDIAGVLEAVPIDTILAPRIKADVLRVFRDLYEAAGEKATADLKDKLIGKDLAFSTRVEEHAFEVMNRRGLEFLERYGAERVKQITDDTKAALRGLIAEMHEQGVPTYQQAQRIKELVGLTTQHVTAVENLRQRLRDEGVAPKRIEALVARKARELHHLRATNIARTEAMFAASAGQRESWQQAADEDLFDPETATRVWSTALDEATCDICSPMDGQEVRYDQPFITGDGEEIDMPPAHVNCLPGDALVTSADGIAAQSVRTYDGDLIVLRTAAGYVLACTPNHPILTDGGWLPAHRLNLRHHVVSSRVAQRITLAGLNQQYMPSTIHQVADTFRDTVGARPAPRIVAARDFHGDGVGSEVAIIRTNRLLWDRCEPTLSQVSLKRYLGAASVRLQGLPRHGALAALGERWPTPTGRLMCRHSLLCPLCGRHARPLKPFGSRSPAHRNVPFLQSPTEGDAVGRELARQLQQGLAGEVFANKVVNIDVHPFRGQVFNLQTKDSFYIAHNIVTHNCRCDVNLQP
ncbi:MAG: phage minor head protein [Bradyrhizobium sp.]|uniref:phage minor head protein n=1 Tax=Bradyrhizobium sp. TaxID=376 RepID=UPI003D14C131